MEQVDIAIALQCIEQSIHRLEIVGDNIERNLNQLIKALAEEDQSSADVSMALDGSQGGMERTDGQEL